MGRFWIFIAAVLFLISGPLHSLPLLMVSTLLLLLAGVSRLWARYSLFRLEHTRTLSSYRAFPGEEVEVVVQLTNQKALPLPWVQVDDELPQEITLHHGTIVPAIDSTRWILRNLVSLGWYHRITRRYTCTAASGDIFIWGLP